MVFRAAASPEPGDRPAWLVYECPSGAVIARGLPSKEAMVVADRLNRAACPRMMIDALEQARKDKNA